MDSFGIGASLDAGRYGDEGADTFGHIAENAELDLPHLKRLGLYHAHLASTAKKLIDLKDVAMPKSHFGYAVEKSLGKDTPSGHWELAGVPVMFDWGYFPHEIPCFPKTLTDKLIEKGNLPGVLGNKHASGTTIIEELGEEHIKTGKPIVYTSADSVLQIAAHETHFGLARLYELCEVARDLVDELNIGRVIARPFMGEKKEDFERTYHRKDYASPPPALTLLDKLKDAGREVVSIGKIADIYAHSGITQTIKGDGNDNLFDETLKAMKVAPQGSLVFTNFVDFDSKYGHRRDLQGYANALMSFDKRLPELEKILQPDDMVVIAADHGCDPSFEGSDHTREHIPVLAFGPGISSKFIGRRDSFADIGQSIAAHLDIPPLLHGVSFIK
jgi:phosphopentomutase